MEFRLSTSCHRCKRKHGVWLDRNELEKIQVFSERWETKDAEIAHKYTAVLNQVKANEEKKFDQIEKSMKVSRFGFMNRFAQLLHRKGLF